MNNSSPDDALCTGADRFDVLISFEDGKRRVTDLNGVELIGHVTVAAFTHSQSTNVQHSQRTCSMLLTSSLFWCQQLLISKCIQCQKPSSFQPSLGV